MRSRLLLTLAGCIVSGCGSFAIPTNASGNLPRQGSVIPDTTFQLAPSYSISLEKLVYWGIYAGTAYLILDPLAPNWNIEQAQFTDARYHLSLHMKRVYAGGAGEARVVFRQRAETLAKERGYDGYEVLQYTEGMESSVLGSQRTAEGVIRLTKAEEG